MLISRVSTVLTPACLIAFLVALALLVPVVPARAATSGPQWFPVSRSGSTLHVPYWANHSIQSGNATRAVVVIHGSNRTASSYFDYAIKAASASGDSQTLIVAPLFATATDISNFGFPKTTLYWSSSGWKQGSQSLSDPFRRPFDVSSFEVLDALVRHLADRSRFPNQRQITVIGHSAGGQFAVRHAATSRVQQSLPSGLTLQHVVANPSSYVYMDGARANGSGGFETPSSATKASCPGYNNYKYGLDRLVPYAAAVGAATIRQQFASRRVAYLLGTLDSDPNSADLDLNCAAALQGAHRLERGQKFFAHLGFHYGSGVYRTQSKHLIDGAGHSASKMLASAAARSFMFGSPSTESTTSDSAPVSAPTPTPTPAPTTSTTSTTTTTTTTKVADDTFDRTLTGGWGTASTGGAWTQRGGSAANYSVSGGIARHSLTSPGSERLSILGQTRATNVDIKVRFRLRQLPVGGNAYVYAVGRFVDSKNYWRADVRISPKGVAAIRARSVVNGEAISRIGYRTLGQAYRAGEWWTLRFRIAGTDGTKVHLKAWRRGTSQPGWQAWGTFRVPALDKASAVGVRSIAGRSVTKGLVVDYTRFVAVNLNR